MSTLLGATIVAASIEAPPSGLGRITRRRAIPSRRAWLSFLAMPRLSGNKQFVRAPFGLQSAACPSSVVTTVTCYKPLSCICSYASRLRASVILV